MGTGVGPGYRAGGAEPRGTSRTMARVSSAWRRSLRAPPPPRVLYVLVQVQVVGRAAERESSTERFELAVEEPER
jgi:hypothetical protein